jgi:hypothetical protein
LNSGREHEDLDGDGTGDTVVANSREGVRRVLFSGDVMTSLRK